MEAELRALVLPQLKPGERIFEWNPVTALTGKRFTIDHDVDQALDKVARDLKAQIREGFIVVVKRCNATRPKQRWQAHFPASRRHGCKRY